MFASVRVFAVSLAVLSAACAGPEQQAAPKGEAMVAAADPYAVEAGLEMLRAGGTAIDAAIAVEVTLGLVEPDSSGIGGGGFLIHYAGANEKIDAYDGREWAPAGATPDMFMVNGKPLIWFDNAATTQKPQAVIDRLAYFYAHENSNIHRAAHELAARATDAYEQARKTVARFIGAASPEEIIFVRGATEGINLPYPIQTAYTSAPDGTLIMPYPDVQPVVRVDKAPDEQ